tara:strand:- start:246 stop:476 length:231 start_codon:yes stop_codon:yes gene_type:complete
MEVKNVTRQELNDFIAEKIATMDDYDRKWIYNYFNEFDCWPLLIDGEKLKKPLKEDDELEFAPGQGVWNGGEECPF